MHKRLKMAEKRFKMAEKIFKMAEKRFKMAEFKMADKRWWMKDSRWRIYFSTRSTQLATLIPPSCQGVCDCYSATGVATAALARA